MAKKKSGVLVKYSMRACNELFLIIKIKAMLKLEDKIQINLNYASLERDFKFDIYFSTNQANMQKIMKF